MVPPVGADVGIDPYESALGGGASDASLGGYAIRPYDRIAPPAVGVLPCTPGPADAPCALLRREAHFFTLLL